jgi:peptidyl-tRNA hydrolase
MIDELINALENYKKAKKQYKKDCKKCEYDSSYFLSQEIEYVENSKKELHEIFKMYIASIVKELEIKNL